MAGAAAARSRQGNDEGPKKILRRFWYEGPAFEGDKIPGCFVFARKKFLRTYDQKYKLAPVTEGPFRVVSNTDTTVAVRMGEKRERLSRHRVVEASTIKQLITKEVL